MTKLQAAQIRREICRLMFEADWLSNHTAATSAKHAEELASKASKLEMSAAQLRRSIQPAPQPSR